MRHVAGEHVVWFSSKILIRFLIKSNKEMNTCIRWANTCFQNIFKEICCGKIRNFGTKKAKENDKKNMDRKVWEVTHGFIQASSLPWFKIYVQNWSISHHFSIIVSTNIFWLPSYFCIDFWCYWSDAIWPSSTTMSHSIKHCFCLCCVVLWKPH